MEFIVPKFIDREPKILGPFTFKQLLYMIIPGAICVTLYFSIGKKHLALFIFITLILMGGGLAFCFLKIKGHSLPVLLQNFFKFSLASKTFIWRRKMMPPKFQKVQKEEAEAQTLKVAERSHLQKISVDLETRKRINNN